jgi:phosphoadenosine phosphosulfate reductase
MQITLEGKTKEQVAIERLRQYEPPEGYYLAFSGGKDSMCIYNLALMAGVKFDAHYSVTGIDPPELVQFIRKEYPNVKFEMPDMSIWRWIEKKGLPTRVTRWCCQVLKERGGEGRVIVTGIRAEESSRRAKLWNIVTLSNKHVKKSDRKTFVNPIIDWTLLDVWDFIETHKLPYCSLYDTFADRLGCVMCPLAGMRSVEQIRYPKIKEAWHRAALRYWENYGITNHTKPNSKARVFSSAEDYWQWWLSGKSIKEFLKENQSRMNLSEVK